MGGIFIRDETSADFCSGCRWLEGYTKAYNYKLEREAYKTGNVFFNSSLATATHSLHAPSMIVVLSFLISSSENEIHFWRSPTYNLLWILQYNIAFPFFVINILPFAHFGSSLPRIGSLILKNKELPMLVLSYCRQLPIWQTKGLKIL